AIQPGVVVGVDRAHGAAAHVFEDHVAADARAGGDGGGRGGSSGTIAGTGGAAGNGGEGRARALHQVVHSACGCSANGIPNLRFIHVPRPRPMDAHLGKRRPRGLRLPRTPFNPFAARPAAGPDTYTDGTLGSSQYSRWNTIALFFSNATA